MLVSKYGIWALAALRACALRAGRRFAVSSRILDRPLFFSRLRHELREQYQEIEGYPLSHFLKIAASIGKKWLQLTTHNAPDAN